MVKKAESIIKSYFRKRFGALVADELFETQLKKRHIKNLDSIPSDEQVKIGQEMIEEVSAKFYSPDKLMNLKILFLLRFSLNEAAKKVQEMLDRPCDISIETPKDVNAAEIKECTQLIDRPDSVNFGFEWQTALEGVAMVTMTEEKTLELSRMFIYSTMGIVAETDELDDMKLSSIQEFFNIILPVFTNILGDAFDETIIFTPINIKDFKDKYYMGGELVPPQMTIRTKLTFQIGEIETPAEVLFFIRDSIKDIKNFVNQSQIHVDPFEGENKKTVIQPTGNVRKDLELMFKLLEIDVKEIDAILSSIGKKDFREFSSIDFGHLYHALISRYLYHASDNKKKSVKNTLSHIIPIRRKT